ncbi:selenocysteinespecific elongation factor, putative [Acanthamoeba castellanii str. Neff]|uniref:Selenocysteine-specific elongation factor n=1 Tax=Acanthamoeba castellanii (strain ATCC 30010 / Neff) TaxID=1257118 RepID=L8HA04_ACACF|nr:selenocysteinespecific elongation factor, putative [Acanthamoeba castellanii str. Neff]ELR21543.1 selenocysteinespecific elongation factor, putative [Acanthamoeba castellanii str. Neff]
MEEPAAPSAATLNINLGILGHVDSGKTSLAKALSTLASTAAFDKNPQSKQRGITLDLGFSAFTTDPSPRLRDAGYDQVQYTLVDCPGHASLIRTIIGGAQIMDLALLVIDAVKGIQTQTAECLVIAEMTTDRLLMVLNKTDMLPADNRAAHVKKAEERVRRGLKGTKFAEAPMVAVAACPGAEEGAPPLGITQLIDTLREMTELPRRSADGPFLLSVDHCFPVKGQGTVLTGTVLSGSVKVNDTIELPELKVQKKVKSLQVFHKPVPSAKQGDRVGMCVTQLDSKLLERGLAATPGSVVTMTSAIAALRRIKYFKQPILNRTKFHVTVGHTTVMATPLFFSLPTGAPQESAQLPTTFDFSHEYLRQDEMLASTREHRVGQQWALLRFEKPITCPPNSLLIGSRLDTDIHSSACRIAFYGRLLGAADSPDQGLKLYKHKQREGVIDRVQDEYTVIGRGFFKKETDLTIFLGLKVEASTGEVGVLESPFGKTGKFKVHFPQGVPKDPKAKLHLKYRTFFLASDKRKIAQ